jgi:hypothetical protein
MRVVLADGSTATPAGGYSHPTAERIEQEIATLLANEENQRIIREARRATGGGVGVCARQGSGGDGQRAEVIRPTGVDVVRGHAGGRDRITVNLVPRQPHRLVLLHFDDLTRGPPCPTS